MLPKIKSLPITTKLSLFAVILLFLAIPVTVLSVNAFRDSQSRASGLVLGDSRYPDPVVSWGKDPQYRIEICLNTSQRGGAYCNSNNFSDVNNQFTTQFLNNYQYYWFVDLKSFDGSWVQYSYNNFTAHCFVTSGVADPALCDQTVRWPQPNFSAQATYHNTNFRNACDAWVSTCISNLGTTYPNKQVQFTDLPPNITIDTYVHVGSILYDVVPNINTGSVAVTSAPNLNIPKFSETGVSSNNTPFAWTAVPGASYYVIWVSTGSNFTNNGFWYKNVPTTGCTATNCLSTWGSSPWSTHNGDIGPFPPPPVQLAKSTTYYWSVWACSSSDCPLVGLSSTFNFTTESALAVPSVGGLVDSDLQSSVAPGIWGTTHKFQWQASGADLYAVDISNDPNFGNFVNHVISVPLNNLLNTYSFFGNDGGWANQLGANYVVNGNLALQDNTIYYWRVYGRNSSGAVYSTKPWSAVKKPITVQPTSLPSVGGLKDSDTQANIPSGVWGNTHKFEWIGVGGTRYAVDISNDPNFGNFVNNIINTAAAAALTPYSVFGASGWANQVGANYSTNGVLTLDPNTTYYWRVYAENSAGHIYSTKPWGTITKPPVTGSTKPNPPTNLTPNYNGIVCVPVGGDWGSTLTFNWNGAAQQFAVDVSEYKDFGYGFTNKVLSGNTFSTSGSGGWKNNGYSGLANANGALSLKAAKVYYWRVWASNGGTNTTYDQYFLSAAPVIVIREQCASSLTPVLRNPAPTHTSIPTPDVSQIPIFTWTPAPSADYYYLGVSDNQTNLLSFSSYWRAGVLQSNCTSATCLKSWVDTGWSNYRLAFRPPSLQPGKTYYWFVWGCSNTLGCPFEGLRTSSFTIAGILEKPPTNLVAAVDTSIGIEGFYNFSWDASITDPKTDHYQLILKNLSYGNNFSIGGYWKQDVATSVCTSLPPTIPRCTSTLNKSPWVWVAGSSGISNPDHPPIPLSGGTYSFIVVACKTAGCELSNRVVSDGYKTFYVKLGSNAAIYLNSKVGQCKTNGKVDVTFSWIQSKLASAQSMDLSTVSTAFAPGTYLSSGPLSSGTPGTEVSYPWTDLVGNTLHYWRVMSYYNDYNYESVVYSFTTPDCQAGGDGNYNQLLTYIDQTTVGKNDNYTGLPLNYVIKTMMVHEDPSITVDRNLGLCAVGGVGEIGILQYIAPTWKSLAGTAGQLKTGADTGHGDLAYYTSGVNGAKLDGCWGIPGRDSHNQTYSYEETFGVNIDAGAWNPFAQINTTITAFKNTASAGCNWSTYKAYVLPGTGKIC